MLRRLAIHFLVVIRWLLAAIAAVALVPLLLAWLVGASCRDVIDSREFWVAWVQETQLASRLRGSLKEALANLDAPGTGLGASSPATKAALVATISEVEAQLNDELDTRLGEHLDDVVAFLSARSSRFPFEFGVKSAFAGAARQAATRAAAEVCQPSVQGTTSMCDAASARAASIAAERMTKWLSSSTVADRLSQSLLGSLAGLHQVRAGALALRGAIHLLGLAAAGCLLALCLTAWRVRTIATLLGSSLLAVSASLTPFVELFNWAAPQVLGPEAGEVAARAAGMHPLGVRLHLAVALLGLLLLGLRLLLPRWRARLWKHWCSHENPAVRRMAEDVAKAPAGLLEPAHLLRVLLNHRA